MIGTEDLPEIALQASSLDGRYRLLYSIGEGRFAQVKLAVDSQTGKKVAVKIMREVCATDTKSIECFLSEVTILNQVAPCPHVVQLQRVCLSNNDSLQSRNPGLFYYVMKVAENGELFKFLLHTPKFDEIFARHYFSQLLTGIEYLHEEGFAHRDIKPENILIDKKLDLKLCDFGFAARCKSDQGIPILFDSSDPVGSPEYNAPEITQSALSGRKYEAQAADIFSAGCVLFMMVLGNAPFESSSICDRYYSRFCLPNKASFWKIFSFSCKPSASFKDLIHGMLEPDPTIRLTIAEIKKHPWMTQEPLPSDEEVRVYMSERIKIVFEKSLEELRNVLKNKKGAPDIEKGLQQGMKSISRSQAEGLRQKYSKQVKEINQAVVRKQLHIKQQRLILKQAQPPQSNLQPSSNNKNKYPTNNLITPTSIQTSIDNLIIIPSPQESAKNNLPQFSPKQQHQSNTPFYEAITTANNDSINHNDYSHYETHKISSNSPCIFEKTNTKKSTQLPSNSTIHNKKRPSAGYQSDDCIQNEPLSPPVPKRIYDSAPSSMTYNDSS